MALPEMTCMHDCPPWGYCATKVTAEQFMDGVCGSPNGVHGYDGYITQKEIDQRMRDKGLGHLVERQRLLDAMTEEDSHGA